MEHQMEKREDFLGISGTAWAGIAAVVVLALIVLAFFRDSGSFSFF